MVGLNKRDSVICIITARGGSKRIPRKNVRTFCGKPIIAYSIDAALGSGLFDEVMVSTDDYEIASISKRYGAKVPFMRSSESSGDFATTADVILEVLSAYREVGRDFALFCCIYPTAPFVTASKLRAAAAMLEGADSVLAVQRFSFPPQRGMVMRENGFTWWQPGNELARSQDLEPVYHDVGQFYFGRISCFLETKRLVTGRVRGFEVLETEAQDIDNESDWAIAEMKFTRMVEDGKAAG